VGPGVAAGSADRDDGERTDLTHAPEYATEEQRFRNRPQLTALLTQIFKMKSSSQWLDLVEKQGAPAGPIYKVDEVFADPLVEHLGIAAPLHHPTRGDVRVVGQPITLSRTPAHVVSPLPE
jgi:crotonobetainyl-CoA:carnitine CoA-transferase CaiB-like acyl-CoA transferase